MTMLSYLPPPSESLGPSDPPSRPTLDSTAFPHILDQILAFSDYDSLLAFRRMSRRLKTLADGRLNRHLIFSWEGEWNWTDVSIKIIVRSPHGLIPFFAQCGVAGWICTTEGHLSSVALFQGADLSQTQVIEHLPSFSSEYRQLLLDNPTRPSSLTTRIVHRPHLGPINMNPMWAPTYALKSDTVVQFARLTELLLESRPDLQAFHDRHPTHPRVVRNIAFHPDDTIAQVLWRVRGYLRPPPHFTPCGQQAVYIFHRAPTPELFSHLVASQPEARCADRLLREVFTQIAVDLWLGHSPDAIIVGLEALHGAWINERHSYASEKYICAFLPELVLKAFAQQMVRGPRPKAMDVVRKVQGIKFMSLKEYCRTIGPERTEIEVKAGDWF